MHPLRMVKSNTCPLSIFIKIYSNHMRAHKKYNKKEHVLWGCGQSIARFKDKHVQNIKQ